MKHLVIIGVGGFAREVYGHALESIGYGDEWDIKGFLDGDIKLPEEEYSKLDKPLLGDVFSYSVCLDDVFICAIADATARKRLTDEIINKHGEFINLIHKRAIIQPNVHIGIGNIISPNAHINDHGTIGNFVILNDAGMGHDSEIGDYSSMMGGAGLCGYAKVGRNVYMATNSVALPHAVIEDDVYLGVGSVVFKKAKKGRKYFGNPAVPI